MRAEKGKGSGLSFLDCSQGLSRLKFGVLNSYAKAREIWSGRMKAMPWFTKGTIIQKKKTFPCSKAGGRLSPGIAKETDEQPSYVLCLDPTIPAKGESGK